MGAASLSYERALNTTSSFQINALYGSLKISDFSYSAWGIGADYRVYLTKTKEAPRGFFVSPGVSYSSVTASQGGEKATGSAFAIDGKLGYQWIWNSGFNLDLFAGAGYAFGGKLSAGGETLSLSGIRPTLGVAIGYAF